MNPARFLTEEPKILGSPNELGIWWFRQQQNDHWTIALVRANGAGFEAVGFFNSGQRLIETTNGQWVLCLGNNEAREAVATIEKNLLQTFTSGGTFANFTN